MNIQRKIRRGLIAALLCSATIAAADLPVYDGFSNGPRADLLGSDGGSGWTSVWQDYASTLPTGIQTQGLNYPNLRTSPGAAITATNPTLMERSDYYRAFGTVSGGTKLYISFLYRPEADYGSYGGLTLENYPAQLLIGVPAGYYLYGLQYGEYGLALSNIPEVQGEVAFLVLEIENVPATQKSVYRLFVDPPGGGARPAYPNADLTRPLRPLPTWLRLTNDGGVLTDEIRVGATWESVNPPACPADLDGDGAIGQGDLALLLSNYGMSGGATPQDGDLNGDGNVGQADLALLLAVYGTNCQ